jgi:hypothetical protein
MEHGMKAPHSPPSRHAPMKEPAIPYLHLQNAITADDIDYLKTACKQYLLQEGIPCYVLVNRLNDAPCLKLKELLEHHLGERLYYLNDFYLYTDSSFKTNWHMDTELFTFDRAINAWILLSPDVIEDPLGMINHINDAPDAYFHSVKIDNGRCLFGDYRTGRTAVKSVVSVEAEQIHTPRLALGDVLVFNPKQFHRTNVAVPKHALAVKYVLKGKQGFLSPNQVDRYLWPEVAIFNALVRNAQRWEDVLGGLRTALTSQPARRTLTTGPFPDRFEFYKQMVASL